jgi:UDP-glucose:(glucosyl)LPS alpha-1,2-glucosyltransferase
MKLNITDNTFDVNGLAPNSFGGTEQQFRELHRQLPADLLDKFHIYCSRVRHPAPAGKIPILWLHDRWEDPEVVQLKDEKFKKQFAKLIFVSNYQYQTYNMAHWVRPFESVIIPNSIIPFDNQIKDKIGEDSPLRLIYHTTPHRGLGLLYPAFASLYKIYGKRIHLDVFSSFKIYGWEERDREWEQLFNALREHPGITYHGFQPNNVVREALQKAHVFAYPNVWPETSCIAAIEAMSAGCAIIAPRNFGALGETIGASGVYEDGCAHSMLYTYQWEQDSGRHVVKFIKELTKMVERFIDYGFPNPNDDDEASILADRAGRNYTWNNNKFMWKETLEQILMDKK